MKIADFGFARPLPSDPKDWAKTVCGTEKYMAPEIFAKKKYNKAVDVWALGVQMFFMVFIQYPFNGLNLE